MNGGNASVPSRGVHEMMGLSFAIVRLTFIEA
jgi:hypothetical protein